MPNESSIQTLVLEENICLSNLKSGSYAKVSDGVQKIDNSDLTSISF